MLENLAPFLVLVLAIIFPCIILQPVSAVVRHQPPGSRFQLCDLFTLSVVVALPLLFLKHSHLGGSRTWFETILLGGMLFAISGAVWWNYAAALSRVGVRDATRRSLFLGVLLPGAFAGTFRLIPEVFIAATWADDFPTRVAAWIAAIAATLVVAVVALRAVWWVLAGAIAPVEPAHNEAS